MKEIYRDSSDYVELKLYIGGQPVSDLTDVTAALTDSRSGVVLDAASVVPSTAPASLGRFLYLVPLTYTKDDRKLNVRWTYKHLGVDLEKNEAVLVVTPYCSPEDVVEQFPELAQKTYDEIVAMERVVRSIINTKTGQDFGSRHDVITFNGNGRDFVGLNQRIYNISKLSINGSQVYPRLDSFGNVISTGTLNPLAIDPTGWGFRVNPSGPYYDIKRDVGLFDTFRQGQATGPYFERHGLYTIEGDFGWESVPENINLASKLLIREFFSQDHVWRQKGLSVVHTSDWQFEFHNDSYGSTGNMHVDEILASYAVPNMVIL